MGAGANWLNGVGKMSLKTILESGKYVVTAEVAPPKGTDVTEVNVVAERLKGWIDAANVTDQQSSVMRQGSMTVCHLLKQKGLNPIFQIACRDRNRIALQSDLLSAWVMGIEDVLVLTGDLPELGDHPTAKPVFDLDSVALLQVIKKLNDGYDMVGNELEGKPDFYVGAVVNPGADTEEAFELQIAKMEKKVAAGAKFFQTQAIYDPAVLERFMNRIAHLNIPVLAGVIPIKSVGMARYMNENVSGIMVTDELIDRMAKAEDKVRTGIEIAAELIKQYKDLCHGVHIMAIGWERKVPAIIDAAGL
jgi:5,10-methylenetetrahydrofolate reductase